MFKVICTLGHQGIIETGEIYTVVDITPKGNFILEEVAPPEGYTSFDKNRFCPIEDFDDGWNWELEKAFWAEQPFMPFATEKELAEAL